MKNKIIKIALTGTLLLSLASCSDSFFEQYPSNSITEGNFYKTDDDFNQGIYSCYHKMKTQMGFFLNELAYRSDECYLESMAVSTQDRYDIDHFQEKSNNGIMKNIWNAWYNGIYRCNDVLVHMDGKKLTNGDKYRGEALFLRSWWYFSLYRVFGGVPVTTTVVSPADAKTIARCSDEDMYNRLTQDLSEAISLLPAKRSAETARVTKIAAQTLLAKVYLTFGKYPEAQKVLEDAMTDTGYGYWYSTNTGVLADITNPTKQFKSLYSAEDNRFNLINTYTKISSSLYAMTKWMDTYDAQFTTQVGNDFPMLRYADVVLMYAEALGQQGNISEALTYLNKTRKRAGLTELTEAEVADKKAFIQELASERGREFALEGQRWFDLVRLGLAVDYFKGLGYSLDDHNLLFPIPQDQIEIVNDKSILWQNPGF